MSEIKSELHKVEFTPTDVPETIEHKIRPAKTKTNPIPLIIIIFLIMIISGTGVGFGLAKIMPLKSQKTTPTQSATLGEEQFSQVGVLYGSDDTKKFPDEVEGVLIAGGLDGEGTHHIIRQGGKTQTVYVTSSFLDLDQFVNHKIHVWGETFSAQKASWLMDVGGVKIIEKNAEKPFEEEPTKVIED